MKPWIVFKLKSLYETGKMPENSEHELEEEANLYHMMRLSQKLEENN